MSQTEELSRVQANIERAGGTFRAGPLSDRAAAFHIQDLHDYIAARTQIAQHAPDRVLRQLGSKASSTTRSSADPIRTTRSPRLALARKASWRPGNQARPEAGGHNLFDCKPQTGPCPVGCNQCFYNRPGAFYADIQQPIMPTLGEVGDGIVRSWIAATTATSDATR